MARVGFLRDENLNVEAIVIVDEGSGDSIEVQRAIAFEARDAVLGMDTYCVVRGGAVHYGGVLEWTVADNELMLLLSDDAASTLALPTLVTIATDLEGSALLSRHLPGLCPVARA